MNGCFDSDVIIDVLQGIPIAVAHFDRYEQRHISTVAWVEVMTGAIRGNIQEQVRAFLRTFQVHDLDMQTGERAAQLRATYRLRTPDAAMWATALTHGLVLVTRNSRDFPTGDPSIRIPYQL